MKHARTLAAVSLCLLFSTAALAQMGGGGGMGGSGMGSGMGPVMGPMMNLGDHLFLAPDGKALYVKQTSTTSGSTTTTSIQLVAISASGTVAWTWTPPAAIHDVTFPTGLVAVSVVTQPTSAMTSVTSQVVALNLATGAQVWTLSLDGMVADLQATSTGLLAVVMKPTGSMGSAGMMGGMSRTAVSISLTGHLDWSLPLD